MSETQVSTHDSISSKVETTELGGEAVRCAGCHAVYEHSPAVLQNEENTVCPECGDAAWLAVSVPVPKSGAASPA
jgi:rRNA maturation endonuclease Nob1